MDIDSLLEGVLSNAIWWAIGLTGLVFLLLMKRLIRYWRSVALAKRLRDQGIRRFLFSRHEYPERLDAYLEQARHTIKIVSVSLQVTNAECSLVQLFRRKLTSSPSFEICISLLNPDCPATVIAADILGIPANGLAGEIRGMLAELVTFRDSLPAGDRSRLLLATHDSLPLGSAILLDSTPTSGVIQVETKLYRAPRVESFSFEVTPPGSFYHRNYVAWSAVLSESARI